MTDEESRKAFEGWMNAAPYLPQANEAVWQAAVEWATKRERERCARIARVLRHLGGEMPGADRLMAMLQEPKP